LFPDTTGFKPPLRARQPAFCCSGGRPFSAAVRREARNAVREGARLDSENAVHGLYGAFDVMIPVHLARRHRRHQDAAADRLLREQGPEGL
jgi:hypothetical protein